MLEVGRKRQRENEKKVQTKATIFFFYTPSAKYYAKALCISYLIFQ